MQARAQGQAEEPGRETRSSGRCTSPVAGAVRTLVPPSCSTMYGAAGGLVMSPAPRTVTVSLRLGLPSAMPASEAACGAVAAAAAVAGSR